MLPNIASFGIVYYGILCAGGIVVPMNPLLSACEVTFYLSNTNAPLLFSHPDFATAATDGATQANAKVWLVDDRRLAVGGRLEPLGFQPNRR
jgi:long-chain acyl-CoA synthetase